MMKELLLSKCSCIDSRTAALFDECVQGVDLPSSPAGLADRKVGLPEIGADMSLSFHDIAQPQARQ